MAKKEKAYDKSGPNMPDDATLWLSLRPGPLLSRFNEMSDMDGLKRMLKDKMAEIGKILRMERIARGLELHEESKRTRISWYYLRAIKEGRYHVIPRLFDIGYIRMYAEFLDADTKQLLARYKRERGRPPQ